MNNKVSVQIADLKGNGATCIVWSSPLCGDKTKPMYFVDLMGGKKPHLLEKITNNLGAETHIEYASSTEFYLEDRKAGRSWVTKLPFPVHVIKRVRIKDLVSRNTFVTRYAYHHGYFDGHEREFRGFGRVEQWDTEEYDTFKARTESDNTTNLDKASHIPPVLTKSWFHTGAYLKGEHISKYLEGEYYREGDESTGVAGFSKAQQKSMLLDDTILPKHLRKADGAEVPYELSMEEVREACRSLRGVMLRQEIYALDNTEEQDRPYNVSERNYTIELLQSRASNKHAVFFTHDRETIDFHYERKLYDISGQLRADPRVSHAMTLSVDAYGNVLESVAIGYGRRFEPQDDASTEILTGEDIDKQKRIHMTYTQNKYTNAIGEDDAYHAPLLSETRTFEILQVTPDANEPHITNLFRFQELQNKLKQVMASDNELLYENYHAEGLVAGRLYHRLIEHVRQLYVRNDLSGPLPLYQLDSLALPYETYKLAFTPGLIDTIYKREGTDLLPDRIATLKNEGSYILSDEYKAQGLFPYTDQDNHWWIPSGQQELLENHFYLVHRVFDPFNAETQIHYDDHYLLLKSTEDPLHNIVTVETKDETGQDIIALDYRVLQPHTVVDPNKNRTSVVFDILGMVVGTAVMGKVEEQVGDTLAEFESNLSQEQIDAFYDAEDPHDHATILLQGASTRIIYDLHRFYNTQRAYPDDPFNWLPVYAASIARETHFYDLPASGEYKAQISFSYSDGFGREIQKKIQAEPGPVVDGGLTVNPRWVGSGWTIFNNKGKPVRQYEPFFSQLNTKRHQYEFGVQVGVSPILFHDPMGRVVATLHPNHSYEKVIFDPWRQETWDVNDTITLDPRTDDDLKAFLLRRDGTPRLPKEDYIPSWYDLRTDPAYAQQAEDKWPNPKIRDAEKSAALKAKAHAATPSYAYADALGRTFITVTDTGKDKYKTCIDLDIEGNQRLIWDRVKDPNDDSQYMHRKVMMYDYDMLSTVIHQSSMEAGQRWMLNNVADNPIRRWDSRAHTFQTVYDDLQRPTHQYMEQQGTVKKLIEHLVYGENHPEAHRNLRGQLYRHYDQAGVFTNAAFDFKGNPLEGHRQLASNYREVIDWINIESLTEINDIHNATAPFLEEEKFISSTRYDAINRPVQLIAPHSTTNPQSKYSIIQPSYNEANLLDKVDVWIQRDTAPGSLINPAVMPPDQHVVANIEYNAKGQREKATYGNQVETFYTYDKDTFRLTNLTTKRQGAGFNSHERHVQDLSYLYDPVGNITRIQDDADIHNVIYFKNQRVEPSNDYKYDAMYRLIEARGREHIGQIAAPQTTWNDAVRSNKPHPGDGNQMRRYTEAYDYDLDGNIKKVDHKAPAFNGYNNGDWVRSYEYQEQNPLDANTFSNRLSATTVGGQKSNYFHDPHGNMVDMDHLTLMQWDYRDQLQATARQRVNNGGNPESTYYVYDASGQRVRKVTDYYAAPGNKPKRKKERIYLNGFEIYREYPNNGNTSEKNLERESLHIMDDQQRVALIETKTLDDTNITDNNNKDFISRSTVIIIVLIIVSFSFLILEIVKMDLHKHL